MTAAGHLPALDVDVVRAGARDLDAGSRGLGGVDLDGPGADPHIESQGVGGLEDHGIHGAYLPSVVSVGDVLPQLWANPVRRLPPRRRGGTASRARETARTSQALVETCSR